MASQGFRRQGEPLASGSEHEGGWQRRRRQAAVWASLATLAAVAGMGMSAEVAHAGTYHLYTCRTPNGSPAPADGWTPSITGDYMYASNDCPNALSARIDGGVPRSANQTTASWVFSAPPNTEIAAATLSRSGSTPGGTVPYATWVFWFATPKDSYDSADVFDQCANVSGCSDVPPGTIAVSSAFLTSARSLFMHASCGGGSGTRCPDAGPGVPDATVKLHWADITLRNLGLPSASGPSGPLVSGNVLSGGEDVAFTASETGSGIYAAHFIVDGRDRGAQPLDSNGGRCIDHGQTTDGTRGFLYASPCRTSVNASLRFDTTTVADGVHSLQITVEDAAGDTATVYTGRMTVRNAPSPEPWPARPPVIGGTPRAGEPLQASTGVWSGTGLSFAFQWQHCAADGSACTSIPGATDSRFTPSVAEVGRALRVLVTATNGSGSDTAASAPTGPLAAAGASAISVVPGPRGPVNGSGASDRARLERVRTSSTIVVSFGRDVRIRGRLLDVDGHPISRARLVVSSRLVGQGQWSQIGSVTTSPDGGYRFSVRPGPSRLVRIGYRSHMGDSWFSAMSDTSESVRAAARLRTSPHHVINGQRVVFAGHLLGGHIPQQGKQVEIQALVGRRWRDVVGATATRNGDFHASYRFTRTVIRISYMFRAVIRQESGYPYVAGVSNLARVLVN